MIGQQCRPLGRARWFAVAALVALLSAGQAGRAAVRYVNQAAAGPAHDGTSWANAFTTVGAGLGAAASGDEVWVAKGAYLEVSAVPAGVSLYGGFAGTETSRSQRDWMTNPTVLNGAGGTGAVVTCLDNTVVDGLTISGNGRRGVRVSGTATLSNNTVSGDFEYGVRVVEPGTATLSNNTISGNGGQGVEVYSGTATLSNNTISGNRDVGVHVLSGTATLTNNTISGNGGSGMDVDYDGSGTATLYNNIVAFNGGYGLEEANIGYITTFSHNDVYGNTKGEYSGNTPSGQGNISVDPKLSSPYRNVHIQPDSPCRDAGDDSVVPTGDVDIDGQPRLQGGHVDIGSDESDGTVWSVPPVAWHVSPSGDDASDGRTWATAKRTVSAALALVQGADEVWVAKGTYTGFFIVPGGVSIYGGFAGTETSHGGRDWKANPTVLVGIAGTQGAVVTCYQNTVVDGFTVRNGTQGVHGWGTSTLSNNTITGNGESSVLVDGPATFSNNTISGNGNGVHVWGPGTFSNNTISGNGAIGVQVDGPATFSNNTISGHMWGVVLSNGVWGGGSGPATLSNNTISGNSENGVDIYNGMATLSNNTISGNGGNGLYTASGTLRLSNNIVAFNGGYGMGNVGASSVPTFSHNDVFGNTSGEYSGYTPPDGQGNIGLDPLFVNRASRDYHLAAGSPCIDAGDDSVVVAGDTDLDGKPRIIGAHVDIGAYEYGTGPAPFTVADVTKCLSIACGLISGSPDEVSRLDVEPPPVTGFQLDIRDALRIARKVAGLEANP